MSDKLFKKEDVHLELPQLAYWDKEITEFANKKVAELIQENEELRAEIDELNLELQECDNSWI